MDKESAVVYTIGAMSLVVLVGFFCYFAGQADFARDCRDYGKHMHNGAMYICQEQK